MVTSRGIEVYKPCEPGTAWHWAFLGGLVLLEVFVCGLGACLLRSLHREEQLERSPLLAPVFPSI
jgi:hypothetical protein